MDEALCYYLDEHIDPAISDGLRARGIDVITTGEANRAHQGLSDSDQLAYAGVVLLRQVLSIGEYIEYLELLARTTSPEAMCNLLLYCRWR